MVPRPRLESQVRGSAELEELGRPHLVLAHAHRDDRVAILRQIPQLVDGVLLQNPRHNLLLYLNGSAFFQAWHCSTQSPMSSGGSTILFKFVQGVLARR